MNRPTVIHPRFTGSLAAVVENGTLPDTGEILRNTPVSDGQGGQTDSWATAYSGPARVERPLVIRPAEGATGGALTTSSPWMITFEPGVDVQSKDRVEVTHAVGGQVRMFEVVGLMDPQSFSPETQILAMEVY